MSKFCEMNGNINHIAEVSTSRVDGSPTGAKILTSTNINTGDVRDTLDGKLAKMDQQFQDRFNTLAPVPWTPNTEIKANQSLQVFEHDGLFYLPNVKLLPFTTGTTFNSDNWVLSDLVTKFKLNSLISKCVKTLYVDDYVTMADGVNDNSDELQKMFSVSGGFKVSLAGAKLRTTKPIIVNDNQYVDITNADILSDHGGRLFVNADNSKEVDGLILVGKGMLHSQSGIDGDYVTGNSSMTLVNSYVNGAKFKTWGEDAVRTHGNCHIEYMEFDDIRDNPVAVANNNNTYGTVKGGSCGGDGVLLKGNNNHVDYFNADIVGYRTNQTGFIAGSLVVIGADGDTATNCSINYAECDTIGALVVGIDGKNNYVGTAKCRASAYTDMYPAQGGKRKVEAANLNGKDNHIERLVVTESIARGVGIGGVESVRQVVRNLEINELLVGLFINVDTEANKDCEVTRAVCQKSPNNNFLRINGNGFASEYIKLMRGVGSSSPAGSIIADDVHIDKLVHNADERTSTGTGYTIRGRNSLNYVEVTGFGGTSLDTDISKFAQYYLSNNTSGYDRLLKVRGTGIVTNSTIIDKSTLSGDRSPIASGGSGVSVVFVNNISADMIAATDERVINSNNIN